MNRWFTVVIFGLFGGAGCEVINHYPNHITEQPDNRQLCSLLIAGHRSNLEPMFEAELYAGNFKTDEWHDALNSLGVATSDSSGHARNPSSVLQSTFDKLMQMKNAADRMRLEYLLLGSRMSLEERRRFDTYCVVDQLMTEELPN
jgi:hypothetical protein